MIRKSNSQRRKQWTVGTFAFSTMLLAAINFLPMQVVSAQNHVTSFTVKIKTADVNSAGTNDPTYISVGGREFRIGRPGVDDFERAKEETFIFGAGANVDCPAENDPRHPAITTDDVRRFPIYIRKDADKPNGEWAIESVVITVNGQVFRRAFSRLDPMWLRTTGGLTLYIK